MRAPRSHVSETLARHHTVRKRSVERRDHSGHKISIMQGHGQELEPRGGGRHPNGGCAGHAHHDSRDARGQQLLTTPPGQLLTTYGRDRSQSEDCRRLRSARGARRPGTAIAQGRRMIARQVPAHPPGASKPLYMPVCGPTKADRGKHDCERK
jgi:hypothetical protein